MEAAFKGNYFKNKDFWKLGVDYELTEIYTNFLTEIEALEMYYNSALNIFQLYKMSTNEQKYFEILTKNFTKEEINAMYKLTDIKNIKKQYPKLQELTTGMKINSSTFSIAKNIANANVNINYIHHKMVLTHLCTILDECLAQFIKSIAMYYNNVLNNIQIKMSLNDIESFSNKTDLKEYIIDYALRHEKSFSGITDKISFLLNKCGPILKYDYSLIKQLKIERDCIIHRNGKYDKRAIKDLDSKNIKENDDVKLDKQKIRTYFSEASNLIEFIKDQMISYYIKRT